jgi:hypothetical protein
MIQLSAIRRSCIAILRVSLVSFVAITLCVVSQRVFIVVVVVVYFVVDSVRKLLDTPSCLKYKLWIRIFRCFISCIDCFACVGLALWTLFSSLDHF